MSASKDPTDALSLSAHARSDADDAPGGTSNGPRSRFTLSVEGVELWGRCGGTAEERAVGQRLVIDVRLVPAEAAGIASDELAGTVDYGAVLGLVREAVEGHEYRLIERLADEICGRLWRAYALVEAAVTVRKPAPPVGLPIGAAAAEVVRRA